MRCEPARCSTGASLFLSCEAEQLSQPQVEPGLSLSVHLSRPQYGTGPPARRPGSRDSATEIFAQSRCDGLHGRIAVNCRIAGNRIALLHMKAERLMINAIELDVISSPRSTKMQFLDFCFPAALLQNPCNMQLLQISLRHQLHISS